MYPSSSKTAPKEIEGGGSGVYCSFPLCKSATYNREGEKTGIGFFKFPNKEQCPELYKTWASIIKNYRRCGGKDTFQIKKSTVICEFHFKREEIKGSAGIGRKTLVKGTVPSIFKF